MALGRLHSAFGLRSLRRYWLVVVSMPAGLTAACCAGSGGLVQVLAAAVWRDPVLEGCFSELDLCLHGSQCLLCACFPLGTDASARHTTPSDSSCL
jgi:hypothetical protein